MLSDEHPEMGYVSPKTLGGSPVGIMIYVEDVDTILIEPSNQVAWRLSRCRINSMEIALAP